MPVGAYFKGHGSEVMDNMTKEYGEKKGKSVFYATANKRHAKPMAAGGVVDTDRRMPPPPAPPPMSQFDQPIPQMAFGGMVSPDEQELDEFGNPIPRGPQQDMMAPPVPPPMSRFDAQRPPGGIPEMGAASVPAPPAFDSPRAAMPEMSAPVNPPMPPMGGAQEEYQPSPTAGGAPPPIPQAYAVGPEQSQVPPRMGAAQPPTAFGQGMGAQARDKIAQEYIDLAGKKTPWWQTALQVALTRNPAAAMQSGKLATKERQLRAVETVAAQQRAEQANASGEALKTRQMELIDAQKRDLAKGAQPRPGMQERIKEARDANAQAVAAGLPPPYTEEQIAQYGANWRPSTAGVASTGDVKDIAKAIIDGKQAPNMTGLYRYGAPLRAELSRAGYDLMTAQRDWMAITRHMSSLNGPQQLRLRQAVNFTYDSLDVIEGLYNEWKRVGADSGIRLFNKASLIAAKQLPGEAGAIAQALESQLNDLTSELGTVYKGGNGSTDESLRLAATNLAADWNDATFQRQMGLVRTNLRMRRNSINNTDAAGVSAGSPYQVPQQQSPAPATGGTVKFTIPGGKTFAIPAGEVAEFLKDNPTAVKQ